MAIEDIFKALEEQADAEVNQILHTATVQSDSIEHEARDEAERITSGRMAAAEEQVRSRSAKAVNAARLQVRRDLAAVRDEAVDAVFAEAVERLKVMRGKSEYERVFTALAKEALQGVDGACEIEVAPQDADLAKKVVGKMGVQFTVSPTLDTVGGLAVRTDNGRVVRRNTFESRLSKVRSLASAQLAEVLGS